MEPGGYGYCREHAWGQVNDRLRRDQARATKVAEADPVRQSIEIDGQTYHYLVTNPVGHSIKLDNINAVLDELAAWGLGLVQTIESLTTGEQNLVFHYHQAADQHQLINLVYSVADQFEPANRQAAESVLATEEQIADIVAEQLASGAYPGLEI